MTPSTIGGRRVLVVVVVVGSLLALGGCGDETDDLSGADVDFPDRSAIPDREDSQARSDSRREFVEAADEICRELRDVTDAEADARLGPGSDHHGASRDEEAFRDSIEEFLVEVGIPLQLETVERLRDLEVAADDRDVVESLLDRWQELMARLGEDLEVLVWDPEAYGQLAEPIADEAARFGFSHCFSP